MTVPRQSIKHSFENKMQQPKPCFTEKNTRIRKFKSTSRFSQDAFDVNSGIYSTQQRVREPDDLKLIPSDQERRNKEQVINHRKDIAHTNNINEKLEISVIANCVNNNFENINNSAMKDTDNMKEITNKMAINKLEAALKKMLGENKKLYVTFLSTAKMLLLKRFRKMINQF